MGKIPEVPERCLLHHLHKLLIIHIVSAGLHHSRKGRGFVGVVQCGNFVLQPQVSAQSSDEISIGCVGFPNSGSLIEGGTIVDGKINFIAVQVAFGVGLPGEIRVAVVSIGNQSLRSCNGWRSAVAFEDAHIIHKQSVALAVSG